MNQEFLEPLPKSTSATRKWASMAPLEKCLLDMALCHSLLAGYSKFEMLLKWPSLIKRGVYYVFTLEIDCAKFVFCGRTDKDSVVLVNFFVKALTLDREFIFHSQPS
jgi:hypothetical protein